MKSEKLNNSITLNFNDEYKKLIEKLAAIYQRKPAELLRLLLIPILHDKYAEATKTSGGEWIKL